MTAATPAPAPAPVLPCLHLSVLDRRDGRRCPDCDPRPAADLCPSCDTPVNPATGECRCSD